MNTRIRTTHTCATLEVPRAVWDAIARDLREAGYDHAFDGDMIDMTGIALVPPAREAASTCNPADLCAGCRCEYAQKI